jgi:hypothetical protein
LYLLSFLDRTNIGNAKIDGLQKSLHNLTTGQYNACLSLFFVSYALFEPLTNILLKRLKPSIFIPIIMYVIPNKSHSQAKFYQGHLGLCHDFNGLCGELLRSDGCSLVPRNG